MVRETRRCKAKCKNGGEENVEKERAMRPRCKECKPGQGKRGRERGWMVGFEIQWVGSDPPPAPCPVAVDLDLDPPGHSGLTGLSRYKHNLGSYWYGNPRRAAAD